MSDQKIQELIENGYSFNAMDYIRESWDIFKKHFIEVHPVFFNVLVTRYPNLTNDDLKLCAYLKLQLSSKEIARLLNLELAAINKRRNRLRKKLNIESSVDLHEFILTVDN